MSNKTGHGLKYCGIKYCKGGCGNENSQLKPTQSKRNFIQRLYDRVGFLNGKKDTDDNNAPKIIQENRSQPNPKKQIVSTPKKSKLESNPNIKLERSGTVNKMYYKGEFYGNIDYKINDGILEMDSIFIVDGKEGQGLYRESLKKVLADNEISRIDTTLTQDNKKAFLRALGESNFARVTECFQKYNDEQLLNAVKETPAYKVRKSLGYGNISDISYEKEAGDKKEDGIKLIVKRDD